MMSFLRLIQWPSVLVIAVFLVLLKYALLLAAETSHGVVTTLSTLPFFLLVFSVCSIVSAGHIIEAVYNVDSDIINRPKSVIINKKIKEKDAFTYFIILNSIGVGLGFYISNAINHSSLFAVFFILSALWYIHASALQQISGVGNIIMALIYGLIPLIFGIFELYPAISFGNRGIQIFFLSLIKDYAIFIALVVLVKNIVKNLMDINGNYNNSIETLAVVLGRQRTTKIAFLLSFLPLFAIIYYSVTYMASQLVMVGYLLLAVVAPLLYTTIKLFNAEKYDEFRHCYKVLNVVLVTTILSLILFKYQILA